MKFKEKSNIIIKIIFFTTILFLSGCSSNFLFPKGEIAIKQYSLIVIAFSLMLLIVTPVFFMTFFFVWKYKKSFYKNIYKPNWDHSNIIEVIVWFFPVLIISILSYLSYQSAHELEPSKPLLSVVKPVKIEVVSLDWKWLFIYPEENIATINEIVCPTNTPLEFKITSNSVMNSFFIPSLGSQIYAMPGMVSKLHLLTHYPGFYEGFSANYSGKGFSDMKFKVLAINNQKLFRLWVKKVKKSCKQINNFYSFKKLAVSDENHSIEYFSDIGTELFNKILKDNCKD
ncbi:Cytochrome bo(3) ubiquinol oxidase subunit 2 [Buchnera aphidicola (Tetraneura ulmi)]|uniref:ubiquinol oxidase subunit II n=1 Tax=Buchnera aphidicola TaxID=9 RepID=UPI00346427F7